MTPYIRFERSMVDIRYYKQLKEKSIYYIDYHG